MKNALKVLVLIVTMSVTAMALACGGMPVVAPEPMPMSPSDSWSFLPAYQPGESLYGNADQSLSATSSDEIHGTVTVDGQSGTAEVFLENPEVSGIGTVQNVNNMDVIGITQLQDNEIQFSNDAHYNGFDAVVFQS